MAAAIGAALTSTPRIRQTPLRFAGSTLGTYGNRPRFAHPGGDLKQTRTNTDREGSLLAYLREVRPKVWRCQYSLPKVAGKYKRATVTITGTRAEVEGELARIERLAKIEQPKQSGRNQDGAAPRAPGEVVCRYCQRPLCRVSSSGEIVHGPMTLPVSGNRIACPKCSFPGRLVWTPLSSAEAPSPPIPITPRRAPPCYVMFGDYAAIDQELLPAS